MMGGLAVSIVIPSYDRQAVLPRALASALAQVRPGDEIIVVDDGSTDGTAALLAGYDDPVRSIHTPNRGPGAARNIGVAEARCPLVAFLDSDDEWMPGSLEARRRLLEEREDVLYCFGDFAASLPDGRALHRYLPRWHRDARPWSSILGPGKSLGSIVGTYVPLAEAAVHVGDLYLNAMRASYVLASSYLVRRSEAGDALRFDTRLRTGEDWVCFGRVAGRGAGAYVDAELAWQHGDAGERLTDVSVLEATRNRLRVLELVWGADEGFLAAHRTAYELELETARLQLARALLASGRAREARGLLRHVGYPPASYRVLASLPGPLLGTVLTARRLLRRVSGAERRARAYWQEPRPSREVPAPSAPGLSTPRASASARAWPTPL